jgi:hypothetical protein
MNLLPSCLSRDWRRFPARVVTLLALAVALHCPAQTIFEEQIDAIPPEIDRLYRKGLDFLVKTQTPRGSWPDSYGQQPGVVGLATVALLAHGEDPNTGPYSGAIKLGLGFILSQQNEQTGYIGNTMYNHGFATLALAESYGAVQDARLGPALHKAVQLILNSQARNPMGGWRYSPESSDADTTVSGAQLVALFAARNAGLAIPEEAIKKALRFYSQCQSPEGGIGYVGQDGGNAPRTAIGCLVWALAKQKASPPFQAGFKFLVSAPQDQSYYHYYLYYASQAFFHASPKAWREWNRVNVKNLALSQGPNGAWEGQFGATFTTSSCLLSLALNYRFLPIYER